MNIVTTTDLNTIEGIEKAIADNKGNKAMLAVLNTLLQTKKRELELLAKKAGTRQFTRDEQILKSTFVALRPYIRTDQYDCNATKAFQAVLEVLPITFSKALQQKLFTTSILHCGKSNMLKSKNTTESLNSYGEAVKQSMRLLPAINANDWDEYYMDMKEAKNRADKRNSSVQAEADDKTVQADDKTVQADKDTDKGTTDKKVKVVITRKNGKKK